MIGADFLKKNSAAIDYFDNTVAFYDGLGTIPFQCFNSIKTCACIHRTVCFPFLEILVLVSLPKNYRGTKASLKPLQTNLTPVLVGGCTTSVQDGIKISNLIPSHLNEIYVSLI